MLIKQIFNGPDFEKSLRQRRLVAFLALGVGIVGILCYFFLLPGSGLPDFVQGFYLGAASGICLGAVILLINTLVLLSDPEKRKKAQIQETDERSRAIVSGAFQTAGMVTFFASAAALFVVLPFSAPAFFALIGAMAVYAVTFLIANVVLERKM